jgi:hypothetical protein
MKSVLYVGATLMIGASIYGFVDYNKSQNKKEFKTMYTKTDIQVDESVVDPIEIKEKDTKTVVAVNNNSEVSKKTSAIKNKKVFKKAKKKRKIKASLFSRGGLDDEYIEPVKEIEASPKIKN